MPKQEVTSRARNEVSELIAAIRSRLQVEKNELEKYRGELSVYLIRSPKARQDQSQNCVDRENLQQIVTNKEQLVSKLYKCKQILMAKGDFRAIRLEDCSGRVIFSGVATVVPGDLGQKEFGIFSAQTPVGRSIQTCGVGEHELDSGHRLTVHAIASDYNEARKSFVA